MNPPYDKNLHLKILQEAIKHSDDVVNLSPIRWLQDPLAKREDWADIIQRIKSIDVVDAKTASDLFGDIDKVLGVYHITSDTEPFDVSQLQNKILIKMLQYDSCFAHEDFNKLDGIRVRCDYFGGAKGRKGSNRTNAASISQGIKEFCHYALSMIYDNGYSVENGKFWTENRMPGAGNKVKEVGTPIPSSIKFDTDGEAKNFEAYTKTKFAYYIVGTARSIEASAGKFLPFMPTYKHPWTDEMLYEYFALTDEEIQEIEKCIS
jgi:hypothetical protein